MISNHVSPLFDKYHSIALEELPKASLPAIVLIRVNRPSSRDEMRTNAYLWTIRLLAMVQNIPEGSVRLDRTSFGQPYQIDSDFQFSISHCHERLLIGLSKDKPIGVDLSLCRPWRDVKGFYDFITSANERTDKNVPDDMTLHRIWTGKESVLKMLGAGLNIHPNKIEIKEYLSQGRVQGSVGRLSFFLALLPEKDMYVSSVSTPQPEDPFLCELLHKK